MHLRSLLSPTRFRLLRPLAGLTLALAGAMPVNGQTMARPVAERPGSPTSEGRKPFSAWSASVHAVRDSLVSLARAQVGTRYRRGGTDPAGGFDCSGLVRYVMGALQVSLPRTAAQQAAAGLAIATDTSGLRPGDLLTFGKEQRGVSHIGIYVGRGRYIHASSVAGRVIESDIGRRRSPLVRSWRGVRRVVADADSATRRDGGG